MTNILLLQARETGVDQAEREAIWSHIGQSTAYHNFYEKAAPIKFEGYTHVIFGGSEANISEGEQPWFNEARRIIRECDHQSIPFLGICFGMQFLAYTYGAKIRRQHGEIGPVKIRLKYQHRHPLFKFLPEQIEANAAHFESITTLPDHFLNLGHSRHCPIQIISHKQKPLFGVQFHPEMSKEYIRAIQESTNYKYPQLRQEITGSVRAIISKFSSLRRQRSVLSQVN